MSVKGIIMFLGMNNARLERKILIILDFENGFLPTYLPQCIENLVKKSKTAPQTFGNFALIPFNRNGFFPQKKIMFRIVSFPLYKQKTERDYFFIEVNTQFN